MKKLLAIMLCLIALFGVAYSEQSIEEMLQENIGQNLNPIVDVLDTYTISNSAQHNVWDDAYIGKLLPSVVPHFGVGASVSAILVPDAPIKIDVLDGIGFPLPSVSGNIRIGGIFLPMDFGVNYMIVENQELLNMATVNYQTLGADARLALIKQGVIRPNISLGVGYSQTDGEFKMNISEGKAKISFLSEVVTASVQVSKDILIFTPFVGARYSTSKESFCWDATVNIEGTNYNAKDLRTYNLFEKNNFQVYGGLGFKLLILHTTVGATYDITNNTYGGNLSIRLTI